MPTTDLYQFEEIVNRYQRDLINFHYRFIGNRFEAEDLAQETFVKAYLKLKTLKEPDKLKSWLFMIARNTVIDFFRKNKNRDIVLDQNFLQNMPEVAATDYCTEMADKEVARALEACIDQLVQEDKAIIKLLYYEGFSYKEIADLLKINQNTLKSRLHRARKILLANIQASKPLADVVLQYENR